MRAASLQRALSAGPFGHRNNEDRENGAGEAIRTPDPNLGKLPNDPFLDFPILRQKPPKRLNP